MNNKRLSLMDDLVLEASALRKENAALKIKVAELTSTNSGYATALGKCLNEWGYDHGISLPCHRWEDLYQRLNALKAEHFA